MKPQTSTRGGMYSLSEDMDTKAKLSTLARRLEELEMRNHHEVQAMTETTVPKSHVSSISQLSMWESSVPPFQQQERCLLIKPILLVNTSLQLMHLMEIPITLIGGTTQISHANQSLHSMHPLLHYHSMVLHLSHQNHSKLLQFNKPSLI